MTATGLDRQLQTSDSLKIKCSLFRSRVCIVQHKHGQRLRQGLNHGHGHHLDVKDDHARGLSGLVGRYCTWRISYYGAIPKARTRRPYRPGCRAAGAEVCGGIPHHVRGALHLRVARWVHLVAGISLGPAQP